VDEGALRVALPDAEYAQGRMMKRRMIAVLLVLAVLLTASACSKPLRTDAPISSFSFSHSGMHTGLIYTLSAARTETGWQANLSLLAGEREYILEMTEAEAEDLAAIVRKHELNRWNGFDRVDRTALDGTDFDLKIHYEDGQTLSASGSNAFPKGYKEAHEEILDFFGELMERNGLENPL